MAANAVAATFVRPAVALKAILERELRNRIMYTNGGRHAR